MGFGERSLLVARHRADDRHAHGLEPLAGNQANPAGGGVPEYRVAGLDREGFLDQVLHRHALQHHRRALLERQGVGEFHQLLGGHHARFRIGTLRAAGVGDAIASLDVGDAAAYCLDDAGTFSAQAGRQGGGVQAGTEIDVDEIQADGVVLDARLAGAWVANGNVFPFEDFGAAGLMETDGFGHGVLLSNIQ